MSTLCIGVLAHFCQFVSYALGSNVVDFDPQKGSNLSRRGPIQNATA